MERAQTIAKVCEALAKEGAAPAAALIKRDYPYVRPAASGRSRTDQESLSVFIRDGFIDRYSGGLLVFPPVLRLISLRLPSEFPFHRNWKMAATHQAFWELFPTIDHVQPIARGGVDDDSNWVTTSQLRNSAKANWTLEELGWRLLPPGRSSDWDGLLGRFMAQAQDSPGILENPSLLRWHRAALRVPKPF